MTARRTAATAIILTGAVALSACGGSDGKAKADPSTPPPSSSPSGTPPATAPGSGGFAPGEPTPNGGGPASGASTLGPSGFGALKLGMTSVNAKATGEIVLKRAPRGGGCGTFDLKAHPAGANAVGGYVSPRYGVASIVARPGMRTPEGIGLGSTLAQVKRAYPRLLAGVNGSSAPVPGNPKAVYSLLMANDKIRELSLDLKAQDCHN
ncbi:hypothetical protein [Actinomadura oligospora]|uniref:hypothetical protein n=1 Tax=Actinomadura oligospora TaxID=111804 RepID=UPI0004B50EBC|nr:hypothetical protein [Actinomadura oligospora]